MMSYPKIWLGIISAIALFLPSSSLLAFSLPNDPGIAYLDSDLERQWFLPKLGLYKAWEQTTGSEDVIIAVLDTGIDATHQDLNGTQVMAGYDFIANKIIPAKTNSDDNGHGTLVSGVLGASANNGIGISGALWKVKLMPLKVLNASGEGESENVAKAIRYATDNGASVINMSFGGPGFGKDTVLAESITYAFKRDIVLVAAAGNDLAVQGVSLDVEPVYPICDDNGQNMVIGVTAVDYEDKKPEFANYGKNCVDVSAPGKRILSTIGRDPITRSVLPDRYAFASGTSLATPLVSAQAGLLRAKYPKASNRQIRDRIISTAINIDHKNKGLCGGDCEGLIGAGRVDVASSIVNSIPNEYFPENSIIEVVDEKRYFEISGGRRLPLSEFVLSQKAQKAPIIPVLEKQVSGIPVGPLSAPLDGTLVKSHSSPTVFYIKDSRRLPITLSVFNERGFSFANVVSLSETELGSWLSGKLLTPNEGDLVRSVSNPTVYWVVSGNLHPVSKEFFDNKGLKVFPIKYFPENDLRGMPRGSSFIE